MMMMSLGTYLAGSHLNQDDEFRDIHVYSRFTSGPRMGS